MPEFIEAISKEPPWMADTLAWSLPNVLLDDLFELLHTLNDGVTRAVLVGELDGFHLCRGDAHGGHGHSRDHGLDKYTFHVSVS
jgi:hypothetical protein